MGNTKRTILFAADVVYPDEFGGVHTYIYEVARGFIKKGHTVIVLSRKIRDELPDFEVLEGILIYRYGYRSHKYSYMVQQLSWLNNIARKFEVIAGRHTIDLINAHSAHAAVGIQRTSTARHIPMVYTFHAPLGKEQMLEGHEQQYLWNNWRRYIKPLWLPIYLLFMKWLEERAVSNCRKIIVLSDYMRRYFEELHRGMSQRIIKIPGGVDVQRFRPSPDRNAIRKQLGLPTESLVLLTVRRLVPRMGLDNLIKAMPEVCKKYPHALLIIGGKGPLRATLQNMIHELHLERSVRLIGPVDSGTLPFYYQASDLFVLPSKAYEGFGLVTLEALACGIPVLGTPVGGTIEILSKVNKHLMFEDTSSGAMTGLLTSSLNDICKNTADTYRRFAVNNYSWERIIPQLESLFEDMIIERSGKS